MRVVEEPSCVFGAWNPTQVPLIKLSLICANLMLQNDGRMGWERGRIYLRSRMLSQRRSWDTLTVGNRPRYSYSVA